MQSTNFHEYFDIESKKIQILNELLVNLFCLKYIQRKRFIFLTFRRQTKVNIKIQQTTNFVCWYLLYTHYLALDALIKYT